MKIWQGGKNKYILVANVSAFAVQETAIKMCNRWFLLVSVRKRKRERNKESKRERVSECVCEREREREREGEVE